MPWKLLQTRTYLFGFVLIVGLGAVSYLVLGRGINSSVAEQQLHREQVFARAEASNISSFFQAFGDSVALRARLSSMERMDATTAQDLDVFVEQWRDRELIGGIVLADKYGDVRFNSNILGAPDLGASLADRDYFAWAKNETREEGEYYVGRPVVSRLGASEGDTIVPVASPVYQNTTFVGVVVASVRLGPLTKNYLELMQVSDLTDVYLIDQEGEMLYSNSFPDAIGLNIFEYLKENPFSGSQTLGNDLKNALNTMGEGKLKTSYSDPRTGKMEVHSMSYTPILLGSQNWLLVGASPIEDVGSFATPIYVRLTILLLLIILTIFLFGVISVRKDQTQKKV